MKQNSHHRSLIILSKSLLVSTIALFFFYTFLTFIIHDQSFKFNPSIHTNHELHPPSPPNAPLNPPPPTNISHIMFVLVGSLKTWQSRRPYIESWWRPNQTRGNIFLDSLPTTAFLPWPVSSPPFIVNENITKLPTLRKASESPHVRLYRSILETFRQQKDKNVRWYVMVDDDSLVFVDNLVQVLSKYDHRKFYYIGANSESIKSNFLFSFDMGFGGAGYALSFPLVEALAPRIDECIARYPSWFTSDLLSASCLADLGVHLTVEKGFHQIDFHGDISGFLSTHPQSPILTLHHFDAIDPLFPQKSRYKSIAKLMEAAEIDQSRLFQQTICYHRETNWSFSVSWGYSAFIYQSILPRSLLTKPPETFLPWLRGRPPFYMFNTRWPWPPIDPCEAPYVFFLDSVQKQENGTVLLTTYRRTSPYNPPPCLSSGNHSAENISEIRVFVKTTSPKESGKIECCNVEYVSGMKFAKVELRSCLDGEVIA